MKNKFAKHFTTPLPEDAAEWQRRLDNSESNVTKYTLELDAARGSGAPAREVNYGA